MELKKNPKADLENRRGIYFQIGLVVAIGIALFAFEWKTYEVSVPDDEPIYVNHIEEEIVPITFQRARTSPTLPPPPPSTVIKLVDVLATDIDEKKEKPSEPDPIFKIIEMPEEVIVEEKIFSSVQRMPTFPGCETENSENARRNCTALKMMEFIRDNIKYPSISKQAGIEGKVYLSFVVNSKGEVDAVDILRGVHDGALLDKEAVRVVNMLPNFNPGKQRGKAVSVLYNLPVSFLLK